MSFDNTTRRRRPAGFVRGIGALVVGLALVAAPSHVDARSISSSAGTATAQFLKFEMGGRHAGMGGTYAAYGNDVFSLWGQPASIAVAPAGWQIGGQHTEWFEGIDQQYIGLTGALGRGRIGVTVNTVGVDGLIRATESTTGTLVAQGGTFGARDLAAGLHYGLKIGERLGIGVAGKFITSEIDDVKATSFSGDIGARLDVAAMPGLSVGGSVTNIGPGLKYIRIRDKLPTAFRAGAAYDLSVKTSLPVLLAADFVKYTDRDWDAGAGLEWRPVDFLGLRAGYRTQGDDVGEGLTAGFGVKLGGLTLDYAYVPFGDLGDAHRVSGGYVFGGGRAESEDDYGRLEATPLRRSSSSADFVGVSEPIVPQSARIPRTAGVPAASASEKPVSIEAEVSRPSASSAGSSSGASASLKPIRKRF